MDLGAHSDAVRWTAVTLVSASVASEPLRWLLWTLFLIEGALVAVAYGRLSAQFAHLGLLLRTGAAL